MRLVPWWECSTAFHRGRLALPAARSSDVPLALSVTEPPSWEFGLPRTGELWLTHFILKEHTVDTGGGFGILRPFLNGP